MLGKSIIAGTVLTLMAGGVVYFGTDVSAENSAKTMKVTKTTTSKTNTETVSVSNETSHKSETHPHGEKIKAEKTHAGKIVEAKKLTIKTAATPKTSDAQDSEIVSPTQEKKTQKKWLDQYLKAGKTETRVNPRKIKTKEVSSWEPSAKEQINEMEIEPKTSYGSGTGASRKDKGKFIVEGDNVEIDVLTIEGIEEAEEKGFKKRLSETENIWIEKRNSKKAERKRLHDILKKDGTVLKGIRKNGAETKIELEVNADEDGETRVETETIDMGDGKVMKIIKKTIKSESAHDNKHKKMRIKVMSDDGVHGKMHKETKKDISGTVKIIMAETAKIKMPELRDRAYLDLVTYALKNGDFKVANTSLSKIEQVELRDTARNRIAVAYAKDGNAKKAFSILDDIEVEALRDVMRLQVIEAMIAPEEQPKDMQ